MYNFSHELLSDNSFDNEFQQYGAIDCAAATELDQTCDPSNRHRQRPCPAQVRDLQGTLKPVATEPVGEKTNVLKSGKNIQKKQVKKLPVDTSSFTVEQRLVAAVWTHEKRRMNVTIDQIKEEFQHRFGRSPPNTTTLFVWERKLFSTGSVHDAPRPGRPMKRNAAVAAVVASLRDAPALSVRERATALRLAPTTLRAILYTDLQYCLPSKDKLAIGKKSVHKARPRDKK